MRILVLSAWFPYPLDNGSKLRAYYLLRALAYRHQVSLVAFAHTAGTDSGVRPHTALDQVEVLPVYDDPFRYVHVPQVLKYASPIPLACWPSRAMRAAVRTLAQSRTWEAVVAIEEPVAQYAQLVKQAPRILDIDVSASYGPYLEWKGAVGRAPRARRWASLWKAALYERWLFGHFQVGTAVLPVEVDFLGAKFATSGCQFRLIPNGVDCEHNHPGLVVAQSQTLIYNGALTYSANYDAMQWFLAEVYPGIRAQITDVSLYITGSTKGVDLDGLALDASVRLTGYVEDVRMAVAEATVCVVPIRQGGGTRLKILEAMALGTPVVATAKGAEGLEVVDGEHCLIADTPEAFAERTVQLLRQERLRQRLATNARKLVEERYDWEQIGRQFTSLVEEAVEVRRSRERRR